MVPAPTLHPTDRRSTPHTTTARARSVGGQRPWRQELAPRDQPGVVARNSDLVRARHPHSVPGATCAGAGRHRSFSRAWWAGDATFDAGATRARLTLGAEAAFANGTVRQGDQVAFARIRVRADNLVAGATYRVTHPYGVLRLTADATGSILYTDDSGCLAAPCDFAQMLRGPVGPFLRWDAGAPEGYVGDGTTPHAVVGSPLGTNEFRMERVTTGGGAPLATPVPLGQTDQFVVQGRMAALRAQASPRGGTYTAAQQVVLSSSNAAADIHYTTDGTEPTAGSTMYAGPITVDDGVTRLKFVAIAADGSTSPVVTETYTIDTVAPAVAADPPGGTFGSTRSVALSSDDPTAAIYYTTDGSTPTAAATRYTDPVEISRSLTLKARAIDPSGNVGAVGAWDFVIDLPTTALTLATPSATTVDFGQTTDVSGRLTSGGAAVAGGTVTVQSRALNATAWVAVAGGSATTAADGSYSVTGVRPAATGDYRVVFEGDATHAASASSAQRVSVRGVVTFDDLAGPVRRGRAVVYSGTLSPTHAGATIRVTVVIPGRRNQSWTATVADDGTWRVRVRAPKKVGSYSAVARWSGDADHLAASSDPITVRVIK